MVHELARLSERKTYQNPKFPGHAFVGYVCSTSAESAKYFFLYKESAHTYLRNPQFNVFKNMSQQSYFIARGVDGSQWTIFGCPEYCSWLFHTRQIDNLCLLHGIGSSQLSRARWTDSDSANSPVYVVHSL